MGICFRTKVFWYISLPVICHASEGKLRGEVPVGVKVLNSYIIFSFSAIIAFQTEYHNTKSGYQRRKARIFRRSRTVPARRRVVLLFFVARMC